jgi:hypothetical protein
MPERTPYPRSHLQVDRLYHESPTGRFFHTPDGMGCIWYDTYKEAMDQTGAFGRPVITIMSALED